jgi:hypothetical protein
MPSENNLSPFRQEALEFVQIPWPIYWSLALAILILLAGGVSWLFWGSISSTVEAKGIVINPHEAIVYVSAWSAQDIKKNMMVNLDNQPYAWGKKIKSGKVINLDTSPADSISKSLFLQKGPFFAIKIRLNGNVTLTPGALIHARIIIRRQTPFTVLMSK